MVLPVDKFIPEIWSARLISNLQTKLVFGGRCNRDYEGEIKGAGDTVRVNNIGRISVFDYTRNGDATDNAGIANPQTLSDGQKVLTIDQSKAFAFQVDDIDKAQAKGSVMEEAMKEASYSLAKQVDEYIASMFPNVTQGTDVANGLTAGAVYDNVLLPVRQKFIETDVPIDELSIVLPAWCETQLLKDSRFIAATANGDKALRQGEIGRAAGFTIFLSNNLVADGVGGVDFHTLAFSGNKAISLADQINKIEAFRPQASFSDAVKGLHVWGAAVMRPEFCIHTQVTKA